MRPGLDDRHPVAQALHELQLMGGEHHRRSLPRALEEHLGHHVGADRIEAGEWLVEDERGRVVEERGGELHPLLVAERQLLHPLLGAIRQAEAGDPPLRGLAGRGVGAPVQRGQVAKVAVHPHLRVQAALLGHVPEAALHLGAGGPPVPAHLAGVRLEDPQRDSHGGRLAGAVGSDEAEHLALRNGEREAVEGDRLAVAA